MSEADDGYLRDSEIALMDALKTVFDLMMYAGVKPAIIDKLLRSQHEQYDAKAMPNARYVMKSLMDFVTDADRARHRQERESVLRDPPAGSA